MVQAYMLIQTEVGMVSQVSDVLARIEGVVRADTVAGPYDVVVLTEAATAERLRASVASRVRRVEGIVRMLTCSILHL